MKEVKTPYRTPQANGIYERFIGSLRRECIDHVLIHGDKLLGRIVTEYTAYFNGERPHQGIDQRIPDQYDLARSKPTRGQVISNFQCQLVAGLAQPHQGVWATLFLTTHEARLYIYDRAPDALKRHCFAKYPFPLSEPVLPLAGKFQKPSTSWLQELFKHSTKYSTMSSRLFGY